MQIWSAEIKELESLYNSLKGRFPELKKELGQLIRTDDANVVMLYSRRCLEVIITDLCESELKRPRKTEPLKGIIDKLNKEEKIPSYITTSMDHLNSLSTYGAHPKEFDPEQVRPILLNLATIIKWYLKYKDTQTISKQKPEVEKSESVDPDDSIDNTRKPKKRLIILLSGLALVVVIVIVALFVFNIIGGGKQSKGLGKSIAVIPFENWNSDEEYAYMGDAIANEINTQLSKIKEFHVFSYTSTSQYKGPDKPSILEIGKELGVNFIIEGTVERQKENVSIHVQVIQAENDDHLWAEEFKGKWEDIFTIRAKIAVRIAKELKTVLTPEVKEQIEKSQTKNPEAYNLYLQGRFFWSKRTEEGLKKSVEYFEKALAADPNYALAYAGLADAYFIQAWWGWIPWIEGNARAKEFALQALDIDKNLAEAHTVLGGLLCWSDWNFEEARKELLLAIELNPNYPIARQNYSSLLNILRQNNEARLQINIALELDPFYGTLHFLSSMYYYNEGKLKESLDECCVLQELDPQYPSAYLRTFYIYIKQGEDLKAVEVLQKNMLLDTLFVKNANVVKDVYSKSGVNGLFNLLIEMELKKSIPSSVFLARWYAMLGEKEEALGWLEKAMEEKSVTILWIHSDPDFDILRSETRFKAMIKKMGLSEY